LLCSINFALHIHLAATKYKHCITVHWFSIQSELQNNTWDIMAISGDDLQKFNTLFEELGIGSMDTEQDLRTWLLEHKEVKQETEDLEDDYDEEQEDAGDKGTKTVVEHHYKPKISNFGGTTKDCISFDVWKYEVECYLQDKSFNTAEILDSVRRSLKGDAAKVVMRLGPTAGIEEILKKLDGLYGQVASEGTLLTLFYSTKQNEDEDVTAWSCRLEDMIQKVQEKGLIDRRTMNEMLRSKLWTGLCDERLKQATRHKFDTVKDYNELVIAVRSVEQEYRGSTGGKKKAINQAIQKTEEKDTQGMLHKIGERLDRMEQDIKQMKQDAASKKEDQAATGRPFRGRGGKRGYRGRWQEPRQRDDDVRKETTSGNDSKDGDIVCFKCGQIGHIALGCRVRTDHLKHLNAALPVPGDEH